MKLWSKQSLIIIFLASTVVLVRAQSSLDRVNFVYQFDPKGEVFVTNKVYASGADSVILFSNIFINEKQADIKDYRFQLSISDTYSSEFKSISYDSSYVGSRGKNHFLKFSIPKWPANQILVLRVESRFSSATYYYDIQPVEILPVSLSDGSKVPIIQNWVRSGTFNLNKNTTAQFYTYYFEAALPPMVTRAPDPQKEMIVDSIMTISDSSAFSLTDKGFYLFQTDTASQKALPLLLTDKYFPKPARLDQLVDPLIYITQREEWEALDKDSLVKRDFDQFWLGITRSADRAKKVIKTYYDRIEEANQFFTSYKEGWKTDRGMIYAIFGIPDRIIRKADKETWYYNATSVSQSIDFEFIRVNSIFSSNHYVLIRDRRYSNSWYQAVNNLRKVRY
ncbi:MAG: GWxTD domain-containing protein [Bacteroidota bacterium]